MNSLITLASNEQHSKPVSNAAFGASVVTNMFDQTGNHHAVAAPMPEQLSNTEPVLHTSANYVAPKKVSKALSRKPPKRWSAEHALNSSGKLIRQDAVPFFINTCEAALTDWVSLLENTSWPLNEPVSYDRAVSIVRTLEMAIEDAGNNAKLLSRFASVQFVDFFEHLQNQVVVQKQEGFIPRQTCRKNASFAVDFFLQAHGADSNDVRLKNRLRERKRVGRRWKRLVGPATFLLLIYSDDADGIVRCPFKADNKTLQLLASKTLETVSTKLKELCVAVSQIVTKVGVSGKNDVLTQLAGVKDQAKMCLLEPVCPLCGRA